MSQLVIFTANLNSLHQVRANKKKDNDDNDDDDNDDDDANGGIINNV